METRTVTIPTISCGHCTRTIRSELAELDGVSSVDAEVETKRVTVSFDAPATWSRVETLLAELGFAPAPE